MSKPSEASGVPDAGQGKRGPDGYLGYLLRQAANVYRYRVEAALRDVALTQPQFAALTMLDAYPEHASADLARLALLTPQTMSTIVGNLEKAGLIVRKPHAVHGRKQHIAVTEAGRAVLSEAKARVYALEGDLVAGCSPGEQAVLRRWLVGVARGDTGPR
ncbi:winged helix-turn-helix transcriptional regulator [Roseospira marina]|uniref:Winged helix-turn-helix transcriptional regulator n=1 Tax=Roseospira marina TaxID=140057 RepID=A0A5M6IBB7_9PROT|nr:MarR family winged helix-turn-helix transcriptional regulator [Roseospira marina]KAA5605536.1 winged helix-turn-helix transcriptional regulator [Roseospira marina]MBB4313405.1 DNA-binding MarR family transcriptional regulator [Roseospira marina]MBB5085854.1 DNA-binding MarR family transcriptional regulator [Roseospira marina]